MYERWSLVIAFSKDLASFDIDFHRFYRKPTRHVQAQPYWIANLELYYNWK